MRSWTSSSTAETRELGARLAGEIAPDGLILLYGDMGSGKTVLTQGIAEGLGIDPGEIQSPTYTLIREHDAPQAHLVHVDLYRLEGEEIDRLGLDEIFRDEGIKVVEWAERLTWDPGADLRLELRRDGGGDKRQIVELSTAAMGAERLREVSA